MQQLLEQHYTYARTWEDIEIMLDKAERKLNFHKSKMSQIKIKSKSWIMHARNYKALEGVIKTLKWTLGDRNIQDPLN
ncbi:MAG: hypothetical protein CMA34_01315 [Euryarchaeota archaeon]|jgi:hypothetical protein|nr:hypothetical protein [Euryarchaeota archaeon]|tara:strand:- start:4334 stop:4567 length:234 start_codon:yes stop_codon:yes gene_type:complete